MAISYVRPDPTQPGWCDSGEAVKPVNEDIAIGWPPSQIPPSRQEFNWLDKQQDAAYKYLCQVGIAQWHPEEQYRGLGLAIGSNGSVYWSLQPSIGVDPVFDNSGRWELTTIRLADADAHFIALMGGLSMYLTQAQGDVRYMLRAEMGNYVTFGAGDSRYALLSNLGQYVTFPEGDARYALRSDLSLYTTVAYANGTYLRIVDAANAYLSKSEAAQTYLRTVDFTNVINQKMADANWYAEQQANNANASARAWVEQTLPPFRRADVSNGSTMVGTWFCWGARSGVEMAMGSGFCQEGDTIQPPSGFSQSNMIYRGWVQSVPPSLPSLPAVGGFVFNMGANGVVADCYYIKQNDGNTRRGRNYCYGAWQGHGWRSV